MKSVPSGALEFCMYAGPTFGGTVTTGYDDDDEDCVFVLLVVVASVVAAVFVSVAEAVFVVSTSVV